MEAKDVLVCGLCKPFLVLCNTMNHPVFVSRCIEYALVPDWCMCTAHYNVNQYNCVGIKSKA